MKEKLLIRAGRVTFCKSVFNSIFTYIMQNICLPQDICDILDDATRKFIWVHHLIIELIGRPSCRQRTIGGLGARQTKEVNIALMGKHVILHIPSKPWSS